MGKARITLIFLLCLSLGLLLGASPSSCVLALFPPGPPSGSFEVIYRKAISEYLHAPSRIATDRNGGIYVSDTTRRRVVIYSYRGEMRHILEIEGSPLGIAVDSGYRLYIGDREFLSVRVFDQNFQLIDTLGIGEGEFGLPNDIAVHDESGRVYVSDSASHVVKVYDQNGDFLYQFGGIGSGDDQLSYPAGIAVDDTRQEVLVADHNNGRIQVFGLDGGWRYSLGEFGEAEGQFTRIHGVDVDSRGRIYAVDAFQSRMQVFTREGGVITCIGGYGTEPGRFRVPSDVAVDRWQRLFVASSNNGRIEMFQIYY